MAALFSVSPLMNKLLTIAHDEAAKNGHVIDDFDKERKSNGAVLYHATCRVCHADVNIISDVHKYSRTGSAYDMKCKPG